jgi:NCAIR mutase (PurE)-related protein
VKGREEAMDKLGINLDFSRRARIGFDEAILCAWKSVEQISAILDEALQNKFPLLLTRLGEDKFQSLSSGHRELIDYDAISRTGFFNARLNTAKEADVAVVAAGTSDLPVAREAIRTLRYFGHPCAEIFDVGVAGIWRLLERQEEIREKAVVIVVAGMDGALPSVVGGLVPGVVIAVPTSVGYGASREGETALHAALASCAPGLTVVNIDNGYGAACAALRVLGALLARKSLQPRDHALLPERNS